jgi:hypothetical protein
MVTRSYDDRSVRRDRLGEPRDEEVVESTGRRLAFVLVDDLAGACRG